MRQRVLYLLKTYLLTVLVFIVAKLVFMASYADTYPFAFSDVVDVVVHGLTLDLSTALYILIVPFLAALISIWVQVPRWLLKIYFVVIAIALSLSFVTDTSLYEFWRFKLDVSFLSYLETPTEAMASVSASYLFWRLVLVLLIATAIFLAYIKFIDIWTPEPTWPKKIIHTVVGLLCIPFIVIGIRGGLGESTTNIGQVYFSQNQFLNHSAVNPVFSFIDSFTLQLDDLSQYQLMEAATCDKLLEGVYTTESLHEDTLLNTSRPDILIILMESAGEQFAHAMPHLQQLKKEGVWFSNCFANSWRTDRGTVAALSGWPSFPTVSVMKIPEKSRTLPSIALTLKQQGYQTSYLYGGDINFTNMRSYLISTGWDSLTCMSDFSLSEQRSAQWGVRDDITFKTLLTKMTQAASDSLPHLWGYSTLSSHEPWDVPQKKLDDEVLNAFAYLDTCLADFISEVRQTPLWNHLLIILVADHGIIYKGIDNMHPMQKNHIPMLWLGGAVRQPREINTLCNQSDLAATLLGQLQLPHSEYTFSRDILSRSYVHHTAVNNYSNAQWLCDSTGHLLYDFDVQRLTVDSTADANRLLMVNKAILQKTTDNLKNR